MTKDEKIIVMNTIDNLSRELTERLLPIIRNACDFGLHKGKPGWAEWTADRCSELAEALQKYCEDDFTLDDIQDYKSGL